MTRRRLEEIGDLLRKVLDVVSAQGRFGGERVRVPAVHLRHRIGLAEDHLAGRSEAAGRRRDALSR